MHGYDESHEALRAHLYVLVLVDRLYEGNARKVGLFLLFGLRDSQYHLQRVKREGRDWLIDEDLCPVETCHVKTRQDEHVSGVKTKHYVSVVERTKAHGCDLGCHSREALDHRRVHGGWCVAHDRCIDESAEGLIALITLQVLVGAANDKSLWQDNLLRLLHALLWTQLRVIESFVRLPDVVLYAPIIPVKAGHANESYLSHVPSVVDEVATV